jgi:hypothetical protein
MGPIVKIRRIDNIIVKNDHLNALNDKITHLAALKKRILSTLCEPPPCDFTVTEFAQTALTLSVNQAGFASRLRFLAPDWVQQLRQSDPEFWRYLAQIKIQISPGQQTQPHTAPKQEARRATGKSVHPANSLGDESPLSGAKNLLSEQHFDGQIHAKDTGKSATTKKRMPIRASGQKTKSHHLRKLVYETHSTINEPLAVDTSNVGIHIADKNDTPQALTLPSEFLAPSTIGKQPARTGLKPEPIGECSALDDALERLWQHVYEEE